MTSKGSNIVITSMGALTPVGATAKQSCAAIHAGIARISEHAYYECTPHDPEWDEGLPLYSSSVPTIDPFLEGFDRLVELAIPALSETVENAQLKRSDIANCGLYMSLPQSDAATHNIGMATNFLPEICKRTGLSSFKVMNVNQTGRTGMFEHIFEIIDLLESQELDYCIVGGVDSYLFEDRLDLYDEAWRLKSERNVDGFIPGEAAVMLMLETEAHARSRGVTPISKISAVAHSQEPETVISKRNSSGSGLTEAINGVLQQGNQPSEFNSVFCSLNGESYYAFEWGIQLSRLSHVFTNMSSINHPAENCGDVGSATGGLLLVCASNAFQQGYDTGSQSLLWASADSGQRIALSLQPGAKEG